MPGADNGGTYQYDGGPRTPVPMPRVDPADGPGGPSPTNRPRGSLSPSDGISVAYYAQPAAEKPARVTGKWTYPAYGEEARR
jgi:hypothetical protein